MDTCCKCKKEVENAVTQLLNKVEYKLCQECAEEMIKLLIPQKESLVNKLFDEMNGIVGKFVAEEALKFIQPEVKGQQGRTSIEDAERLNEKAPNGDAIV